MTARLRLRPVALLGGAVAVLLLVPHRVDLHIAWLSSSGLVGHAADGGEPLWWLLEGLSSAAVFLPVGRVHARLLPPGAAVLSGATLSGACELAQRWIPNRDGSLRDVVVNAIGAASAASAARLVRRRHAKRAAPQVAHDQYGPEARPTASIGVRHRPQFGTRASSSSASDASPPLATATR